jgi:hypothetical protein
MAAEKVLPDSGTERAALAYSMLSTRCADEVARRLSATERTKLREGLSRIRSASDEERFAAVNELARAVKKGVQFPLPRAHDEATCPFRVVESHPRRHVIDVLERVAVREPLQAAVTLCHFGRAMRDELWAQLSVDARSAIIGELDAVPGISSTRTRIYARDITARLGRAIRNTSAAARTFG